MGQSTRLLKDWYSGKEEALAELLRMHLPWVEAKARALLGPDLRSRLDTGDVVQEACVRFLEYRPTFLVENERHLRSLLLLQVRNAITERLAWFTAERRNPLSLAEVFECQEYGREVGRPSDNINRDERFELCVLAMQLLSPDDQNVVMFRLEHGLAKLAEHMGVTVDAARMRSQRALVRLTRNSRRLEEEGLDAFFQAEENP